MVLCTVLWCLWCLVPLEVVPDGGAVGGSLQAQGPDAPLVVSLGFDTFERDPIGDLALRTDDYAEIGRMIGGLRHPVVALQEGGYAVDAIGANAVAFLGGLRGA